MVTNEEVLKIILEGKVSRKEEINGLDMYWDDMAGWLD